MGLDRFGGVLTIVSTVIGGGIVGLPYSIVTMGLYISIGIFVVMQF
jgi:amino acid permease